MIKKEIPKDLQAILSYLQSSKAKLTIKNGLFNGNRFEFFKGKHAVNALCRDTFNDRNAIVKDRDAGNHFMQRLLSDNYIMKVNADKNSLTPNRDSTFNDQEYYIWLYKAGTVTNMLMGIGVLCLIFVGMLYPLW